MALAINHTTEAPMAPLLSSELLITLHKPNQALETTAPTSSKGKLFLKETPAIKPIITPAAPTASEAINLIAAIAAMMVAVQVMEICISELMTKVTTGETTMQTNSAKAMAVSQKANYDKAVEAEEKAREARAKSGIMKILGIIAAAIVCVVSAGTMSALAAAMVIAVTIADTLGLIEKGVKAAVKGMGIDPDSTLGKALTGIIKVVVMIAIILATGGAAATGVTAKATQAGAKAAEAGVVTAEAGAGAAEAGAGAAQAGAEVAKDVSTVSKEAKTLSEAKWAAGKFAGKTQFAGMVGSLNPFADIGIALMRKIKGVDKDESLEQWITLATMIASIILSMGAMYNAGAANGNALTKVMDPATLNTVTKALTRTTAGLHLASAGIGGYVGKVIYDQGVIQEEQGKLMALTTQLKTLVEMFQTISKDQQKWTKQNNEITKQLNESFQYDEFTNLARVSLHA